MALGTRGQSQRQRRDESRVAVGRFGKEGGEKLVFRQRKPGTVDEPGAFLFPLHEELRVPGAASSRSCEFQELSLCLCLLFETKWNFTQFDRFNLGGGCVAGL